MELHKKIILVVGARPNFIKAYPIYKALKEVQYIDTTIIHTGQHFDTKMSSLILDQLGLPKPDIHFNLESKSRAGNMESILYIDNKNINDNRKEMEIENRTRKSTSKSKRNSNSKGKSKGKNNNNRKNRKNRRNRNKKINTDSKNNRGNNSD